VGAVAAYLAVSTLFYSAYNGWSLSEAFYYAVQAGLSIGFGVLSEEDDMSRAFTTLHALVGAAVTTAMLSVRYKTL
jgi:hypothetical protein